MTRFYLADERFLRLFLEAVAVMLRVKKHALRVALRANLSVDA